MYEVTPDEFVLLTPDGLHLIVEPVAKPLDRVLEEGQYVTAGLTGAFQSTVVGGSGKSVVIAQQVGGGGRHSRVDQDSKLQQSRRAPVAVAERAYPGDVEVSDNGLDQGVDDFQIGRGGGKFLTAQPLAEPIEQILAVLARRSEVVIDHHRIPTDNSWFDVYPEL
jgi:hypothetical protein